MKNDAEYSIRETERERERESGRETMLTWWNEFSALMAALSKKSPSVASATENFLLLTSSL